MFHCNQALVWKKNSTKDGVMRQTRHFYPWPDEALCRIPIYLVGDWSSPKQIWSSPLVLSRSLYILASNINNEENQIQFCLLNYKLKNYVPIKIKRILPPSYTDKTKHPRVTRLLNNRASWIHFILKLDLNNSKFIWIRFEIYRILTKYSQNRFELFFYVV